MRIGRATAIVADRPVASEKVAARQKPAGTKGMDCSAVDPSQHSQARKFIVVQTQHPFGGSSLGAKFDDACFDKIAVWIDQNSVRRHGSQDVNRAVGAAAVDNIEWFKTELSVRPQQL